MMLSMGAAVLAQDTVSTTQAPVVAKMPQQVVEIGPAGRTLLRGTVGAVGTNSLTVKSWGGDWVINISSDTKLTPRADLAQFAVGDFVGVQGVASQSAAWTIDAKLVRNWTDKKEIRDDKKEVRDLIKSVSAKNWQGIASNVDVTAKILTLTIDGQAYSIVLASGAKVVDVKFMAMDFNLIKNGDTVRVYGPAVDTTITALVVRDISVH